MGVDREILAALERNCLLTNDELSKLVGLSPSQCGRRRERLKEEGFIRRSVSLLDPHKLGIEFLVFAQVHLKQHDRDSVKKFTEHCEHSQNILEVYMLTGGHDYLVKIVATTKDSLYLIIRGILDTDVVSRIDSGIVLHVVKECTSIASISGTDQEIANGLD